MGQFSVLKAVAAGTASAPATVAPNRLLWGDNLAVMRGLADESVDLIYADPPFFSGRQYRGTGSDALDRAVFSDVWEGGMPAYLAWLAPRLVEMKRLLRPTGTLFVHLDEHAVHYAKVEMDRIFGSDHFINEIIWHYTGGGRSKRYFSNKHDTLLWYGRGPVWTFNVDAVRVPYQRTSGYARSGIVSARGKRYLPDPAGTPVDDVWDIPMVNPLARERTGYPTQKPEALLERIVAAASNSGDVVADFFCGSGTTPAVAERLGRRWLASDVSQAAITVTMTRLAAVLEQPGSMAGASGGFTVERWVADG